VNKEFQGCPMLQVEATGIEGKEEQEEDGRDAAAT
jgi:hypothetical protein